MACGLDDKPFGPHHRKGQSLRGIERLRCSKDNPAIGIVLHLEILTLLSKCTREGMGIDNLSARWQHHRRAYRFDRKRPAIARHIPIQLVVVFKKTKLVVRPVSDRVGIDARRDYLVAIACVDADAIRAIFQHHLLGFAVARHGLYLESDVHPIAVSISVTSRKVAVNSVHDLLIAATHLDFFRDEHFSRTLHRDQ